MNIGNFLVVSDYQKVRNDYSHQQAYKAMVQEQTVFTIGAAIPLIKERRGCVGVAVPYEIHINQYGTVVFFTLIDSSLVSDKMKDHYYKLYVMQNDVAGMTSERPAAYRADSDTQRTGMDAAARMMAGVNRDPDEIAEGRSIGRSGSGSSLYELMKASNPGDPFFDD